MVENHGGGRAHQVAFLQDTGKLVVLMGALGSVASKIFSIAMFFGVHVLDDLPIY